MIVGHNYEEYSANILQSDCHNPVVDNVLNATIFTITRWARDRAIRNNVFIYGYGYSSNTSI